MLLQQVALLRAAQLTSSPTPQQALLPLLSGASLLLGAAVSGGAGQLLLPAAAAVRAASSKGRGGRKQPSHLKGYDRLLNQWHRMTAKPGGSTNNGTKGKRSHGEWTTPVLPPCMLHMTSVAQLSLLDLSSNSTVSSRQYTTCSWHGMP